MRCKTCADVKPALHKLVLYKVWDHKTFGTTQFLNFEGEENVGWKKNRLFHVADRDMMKAVMHCCVSRVCRRIQPVMKIFLHSFVSGDTSRLQVLPDVCEQKGPCPT